MSRLPHVSVGVLLAHLAKGYPVVFIRK
jgi:hypothetical protein